MTAINHMTEFLDRWEVFKNNDKLVDNYESTLVKCFNEGSNVDCEMNFYINNSLYHIIRSHFMILIKCTYFQNLIHFYGKEKRIFNIIFDRYIDPIVLNLFFKSLYIEEYNDDFDINIFDMHYLSKYFMIDKLTIFCENRICYNLKIDNWFLFMEYCLNTTKIPYTIIPGNDRLFSYIIRWIRCFHIDSDNFYVINKLCNVIFPAYIKDFDKYDILKTIICYNNNHEYNISFGRTFCYNCSLSNEKYYLCVFDMFIIAIVNKNDYNFQLCIKKTQLINKDIKFNINTFIYRISKETTLLDHHIFKLNDVNLPNNQFFPIGIISKNRNNLSCNICKKYTLESIGIQININTIL
jgi:hypothetical protein